MMDCPKCGSRESAIRETRAKPLRGTDDVVLPHRRRTCMVCRATWWTVEMPVDMIEGVNDEREA